MSPRDPLLEEGGGGLGECARRVVAGWSENPVLCRLGVASVGDIEQDNAVQPNVGVSGFQVSGLGFRVCGLGFAGLWGFRVGGFCFGGCCGFRVQVASPLQKNRWEVAK